MQPYVLGAVFADSRSQGTCRKSTRMLAGKPLIAHTIEQARASRLIDRVVVSTDDQAIAATARRYGADTPFIRPAELASDRASEWLAWQNLLREIERLDGGRRADALVTLPTASPLRSLDDIEACIEKLFSSDCDLVITVRPAARSPYRDMVTIDEAGFARLVIPPANARQNAPPVYDMTAVCYAARPEFVLNSQGMFEGRVQTVVVPEERALDIDTEWGFRIASYLQSQAPALRAA